jgi:hypothetical protein
MIRLHFRSAALSAALLVSPALQAWSQDHPVTQAGLLTEALAGQTVASLPLTMVTRDTAIHDPALDRDRKQVLAWADSLIGEALLAGAPEINWLLSPDLRRIARRSAGFVPEPDRMGQAVMRSPELKTVPDPLRSSLRTLMALAGGRFAFIPASLSIGVDEDGAIRATLEAVLADSRLGRVSWRTTAIGSGADAGAAIAAAVESFLPYAQP